MNWLCLAHGSHKMPEAHKERTFRSVLVAIFKLILILTLALACLGAGTILCAYLFITHDLPTVAELRDYQPKHCPQLSSINFENAHISTVHPGLTTDLGDIPPHVVNAFLAAEHMHFLKGPTMNWEVIIRVIPYFFSSKLRYCSDSYINDLVIKEFLPNRRWTPSYEIKRIILKIRLEEAWGNKKFLYVFLTEVPLGHGCIGVDAAARFYFGKTLQQLTIAEAALIAGLVKSPTWYNPFKYVHRAQQRTDLILKRMCRVEFITEEQYEEALNQKLVFRKEEQKTP